jgi:uncharacterized Rmd1/YagE family protein
MTNAVPEHRFHALAFPENFSLKEIARAYGLGAGQGPRALRVALHPGEMFLYPFGAAAFRDVDPAIRTREIERLRGALPQLSAAAVEEDFVVREDGGQTPRVEPGLLRLDRLTEQRTRVVALVVAQSAAMEYYERIVDGMFVNTERLVDRLEKSGSVPMRVRALHRFIGQAVSTRSEVLSILHLLDKPDETWEDTSMDRIYDELRAEFDLVDRYHLLEAKLRSVQEALELVLSVARDRRLFMVEAAIVLLIVLEIVLSFVRH